MFMNKLQRTSINMQLNLKKSHIPFSVKSTVLMFGLTHGVLLQHMVLYSGWSGLSWARQLRLNLKPAKYFSLHHHTQFTFPKLPKFIKVSITVHFFSHQNFKFCSAFLLSVIAVKYS